MTKNDIPRLCGGTFFTQILRSRKNTVSQRQRTQGKTDVFHNEDVLFALLQIVQPDAIKPTGNSFETYTTNYKKCDGSIGEDLKFENANVLAAFKNRLSDNYSEVLRNVAVFCEEYIDLRETTKENVLLVKRLIELIRDDASITPSQLFAIDRDGTSVSKSELSAISEIYLPAFILSIWEFIVTERKDNSVGKPTIETWHSVPNVRGRYNGIDGSSITQEIVVTFDYPDIVSEKENTCDENSTIEDDEPFIYEETAETNSTATNQVIINGNFFNAKNQYFGNVENVFND